MYRENCPEDLEAYQTTRSPIREYLLRLFPFFPSGSLSISNKRETYQPIARRSKRVRRGANRDYTLQIPAVCCLAFFFPALSVITKKFVQRRDDPHAASSASRSLCGSAITRSYGVTSTSSALLLRTISRRRRARKEIRRRTGGVHTLVPCWYRAARYRRTRAQLHARRRGNRPASRRPNGSHGVPCQASKRE